MDPVGNNIASQLGDVTRPPQAAEEQRLQVHAERAHRSQQRAAGDDPGAVSADRDVDAAVAQMKLVVEVASGRDLHFEVFEDTEDLFVEIRDTHTEEVIKQIPAEEVLELKARINEVVGLLFDNQA